jgi:hypothetical protein
MTAMRPAQVPVLNEFCTGNTDTVGYALSPEDELRVNVAFTSISPAYEFNDVSKPRPPLQDPASPVISRPLSSAI